MKRSFSASVSAVALTLGTMTFIPTIGAAQTAPPIGGGYTKAIPIPVDDPTVKNIAGALFKPAGAGPFPAVVVMSGCAGLNNNPPEMALERTTIDHLLAKGIATLIVDPFTPRNEPEGICAKLSGETFVQYATRGGNDAVAALKALKAQPDIDPNRIFLQGYSFGAISSLFATDTKTPGAHDTKIAGLVAYFPYCYDNVEFSAPTIILIGEKDDWTPAKLCEADKGKPNLEEVTIFPGATHGFANPMGEPVDYQGHHIVFDVKATMEAQQRADAFMAKHLK